MIEVFLYIKNLFKLIYNPFFVGFYIIHRLIKIKKYLISNEIKKLHIGAGSQTNDDWLGSDLSPKIDKSIIYLDATKQFPFKSEVFDHIYCEHMIEHITFEAGNYMLSECYRILKKGGKIRISTPDLDRYLNLFNKNLNHDENLFQKWIVDNWLTDLNDKNNAPYHILNLNMHGWGHKYIYCKNTLSFQLEDNGFNNIIRYDCDSSDEPHFKNIEMHAKGLLNDGVENSIDMVNYETMNLEATKPL